MRDDVVVGGRLTAAVVVSEPRRLPLTDDGTKAETCSGNKAAKQNVRRTTINILIVLLSWWVSLSTNKHKKTPMVDDGEEQCLLTPFSAPLLLRWRENLLDDERLLMGDGS